MKIDGLSGEFSIREVQFKDNNLTFYFFDDDRIFEVKCYTDRFFSKVVYDANSVELKLIKLQEILDIEPKSAVYTLPNDSERQKQIVKQGCHLALGLKANRYPFLLQIYSHQILLACPINSIFLKNIKEGSEGEEIFLDFIEAKNQTSEEDLLQPLSEEIIKKLNNKFGEEGQPVLNEDGSPSHVYGWAVNEREFLHIGWDDDLIAILLEFRNFLSNDPVFAYIGVTPWKSVFIDPERLHSTTMFVFGIHVATFTNQLDLLRIMKTYGNNAMLDTEDIIEKLEYFDQEFGIDIISASLDGVSFLVKDVPHGQAAQELRDWAEEYLAEGFINPKDLSRVALWWD